MVEVTPHALSRFQVHHPTATASVISDLVTSGETIDPRLVWSLTARKGHPSGWDRFVCSSDSKGIFVVETKPNADPVVRTYLRLGPAQRSVLMGQGGFTIREQEATTEDERVEWVKRGRKMLARPDVPQDVKNLIAESVLTMANELKSHQRIMTQARKVCNAYTISNNQRSITETVHKLAILMDEGETT